MNEPLSEKQREQRAHEVYNAAYWRAIRVGFVAIVTLPVALAIAMDWLGFAHSSQHTGGVVGGFSVAMMFGARLWAIRALRRAGLLHQESETIARTGAAPPGEIIEFSYPSSFWGKVALVGGFAAATLGVWAGWRYLAMGWFGALGFAFFLALTLLILATFNQPNVRVDDRGIFSYRVSFWPRLVFWEQIASADFRRMWGLPSPQFPKNWIGEMVTLKDASGKTLLSLNANSFQGAPPETKAQIVAEVKRRLMGAD